ncbi:MAG: M13 family metallopeptidase [Bacteroidaceae bacterium]
MKKAMTGVAVAAAISLTACVSTPKQGLGVGIKLSNLDTLVTPGNDFYEYANGGWMKSHPLTAEYSRFGSFDELRERSNDQMRVIVDKLQKEEQKEGSDSWKVSTLYKESMDSVKRNELGVSPVQPLLTDIKSIQTKDEVMNMMVRLTKLGMNPYFYLYVSADAKDSNLNILNQMQGGYAMPDRDYYILPETKEIRDAYLAYVTKMFELVGSYSPAEAKVEADMAFDMESELAKFARPKEDLRDPLTNYNKLSMADACALVNSFDLKDYVTKLGATVDSINLGQPEVLNNVALKIADSSIEQQKAYLMWQVIIGTTSILNDEVAETTFDFFSKKLEGIKEMRPRWKRAMSLVNGTMGEAVGQLYVAEFFPPAAKERMVKLVANLQESLGERIKNLTWMNPETKVKALEKLNSYTVKIGYPDKWEDYSQLAIQDDGLWANTQRIAEWSYAKELKKLSEPVDRTKWGMTPQTVNAYYNPGTNEICFPAAILQYPFFDMTADDAFNYGAIGVVIGHEMTHGFDDSGRKYNKEGNLENWWTAEDATNFNMEAKKMVDFFGAIEVAPGVQANGSLTLGENIADHGGLKISYQAFQKALKENPLETIDGFTPEQRFYLAYAGVWAQNIRPAAILNRTKTDEHSLGMWRVNGALRQIDTWYQAFDVTPKDSLFIPKADRVDIW